MDLTSAYIFSNSTLVEVLDDLCVRFIVNLPEEELGSIERICFQIEEAQWYFEDFIRETNPSLPALPLRTFLSKIFAVCPIPLLNEMPPQRAENAFAEFMAYKTRVPVRGAILLNNAMDRCVLVKGWKSGASWSFPRGKINKDEKDEDCAVREVLEETGYDVEGRVQSDRFVEVTMRDQNMRLYIIPGVPEETTFEPRTRKEISKIAWHKFSDLPFSKKKVPQQSDGRTGRYYMVAPFLRELRKWISTSGKKWLQEQKQMPPSAALMGEETEVEDDIPAPPVVDPSTIPYDGTINSDGSMNATENGEATTRLKNFLHIPGPAKEVEEDPSTKLKSLLNVGRVSNQQTPELAPQPNPRALLSILQNSNHTNFSSRPHPLSRQSSPDSQPTTPHHTTLVTDSAPIPMPGYHPPRPERADNLHLPVNRLEQSQFAGDVDGSTQARQTGWPLFGQGPGSAPYLPSPPLTSVFPGPQPMYNPPMPVSYTTNRFPPPPPFGQPVMMHQSGSEFTGLPNKSMGHHPPPTPLDAFIPPSVPSKPPGPGQAGTLLSILKGATPAPPETPSPKRIGRSSPVSSQPHQQQAISLQAPPTPKVSKSQHKNNLLATLRSGATNGVTRPASASPATQSVAPPPRPMTTLPSREIPSRSTSSGVTTPVTATPTPASRASRTPIPGTTPQPASFDKRQSVNSEQAQKLLAMFRGSSASPPTPLPRKDPAIRPSPEQRGPATRTASLSRRAVPRSPLGKEKDGLMAYLETVAKEGGH